MPRFGATPFALPEFAGATRRIVLAYLVAFFGLLLLQFAFRADAAHFIGSLMFVPSDFLGGRLWQPLTYSFVHSGYLGALFDLLSLWFLVSFLEAGRGSAWTTGLYVASVLGTALSSLGVYLISGGLRAQVDEIPIYGCMGGIFGLLVAIGWLFGDVQFLMFFVISIKARYLAIIYALVAFALLFGDQKMYAFANLGGGLVALLYIKLMPRRGAGFVFSESMYGMRNRYYRWKRRRAARKFEVYMRKQGRTVRFDGQGKLIDEDRIHEDGDDKKRWN